MRRILLIMWTAFQSFILRHNKIARNEKRAKKIKGMSTSSFFIPRCDTECMGLPGDCTFSGKLLQQTKKTIFCI